MMLRYRIVPMPPPRMTARYALNGKPKPFKKTMLFKGFKGIVRTSGCVTAATWKIGRNDVLIYFYKHNRN